MMFLYFPFLALVSSLPSALAAVSCASSLNWEPCANDGPAEGSGLSLSFECSNFTVPLDYLDISSNKTITLQVTRIPAFKKTKPQSGIFVNFGGPGFATRDDLIYSAEELMVITGGNYDLIGLDPR
jgi:hypothetical protein